MSFTALELCLVFSVPLIFLRQWVVTSFELWFAVVVGFPQHDTITKFIRKRGGFVESFLFCMKRDPRLINVIESYPITKYHHIYRGSPGSMSRLVLLLFSVPESTTGIRNWNDWRAQPQQGGSEMGYSGSPWTQKHHPQPTGRLGKLSFTDFICCSSPLRERGAATSTRELFLSCCLSGQPAVFILSFLGVVHSDCRVSSSSNFLVRQYVLLLPYKSEVSASTLLQITYRPTSILHSVLLFKLKFQGSSYLHYIRYIYILPIEKNVFIWISKVFSTLGKSMSNVHLNATWRHKFKCVQINLFLHMWLNIEEPRAVFGRPNGLQVAVF